MNGPGFSVTDWNLTALKLVTGIQDKQEVLATGALQVFKTYAWEQLPQLLGAMLLAHPQEISWTWEHLIAPDPDLEALMVAQLQFLLVDSMEASGLKQGEDFTLVEGKIQGNQASLEHLDGLWNQTEP
ncbi:hypothetical protein [Anthocerotibacter panamensis]|uniref:hypothetical protein n=1 Tax=Anthocerotibacter panamensis TaxID=2857077 RepID=UPI001C404B9E|nr:hypothetical protein [Anthocerotibacter panamensis]